MELRRLVMGDQGAPGLGLSLVVFVSLTAFFWATGALFPTELPRYATSSRQIVGTVLMLILIPSYMLAAWGIGQHRSLELVQQLRPLLPRTADADAAVEAIRAPLGAQGWFWGSVLGLTLGLFNTEPFSVVEENTALAISGSISFGQLFMWWINGLLVVDRVRTSRAFHALGEHIQFDLFRLETLRPLSRSGIVDVVIVTGALLLVPLQSLDAEFRIENYSFASIVAAPLMLFFVIWPLRAVHARIRAERACRLEDVDAQLAGLEGTHPTSVADTAELESLLAHRDRLADIRTWPLDLRLFSRIFIYLIIPPMAWAGAALVERIVDSALGAS